MGLTLLPDPEYIRVSCLDLTPCQIPKIHQSCSFEFVDYNVGGQRTSQHSAYTPYKPRLFRRLRALVVRANAIGGKETLRI